MKFGVAILVLAVTGMAANAATILKSEPGMGALKENQVVYVDDGRCPKGQVMKITGGNHTKAGGTKQIERQRMCVPRP
jgi:hypothetical protein